MQPATGDYCLLWINQWWPWADPWWFCMTKSEWSGWAQAVGAILALMLAIGLQALSRRGARRDAADMAGAFATQVSVIATRVVRACDNQDWEGFCSGRQAMGDACEMGRSVPFSLLSGNSLAAYMAIRSATVELQFESEAHVAGGNWQHWRKYFNDFGETASNIIPVIRAER